MQKQICMILLLSVVISSIFSYPGPRLEFFIKNNTQQTIFIEYTLLNGESEEEKNYFWMQEINEQIITLMDALYNKSITKIPPNEGLSIIHYYATGKLADLGVKFEGIRPIPLIKLIKSTYKELKIYTENGSKVIALDTIEKENIEKNDYVKGVSYELEIYEQDDSKE